MDAQEPPVPRVPTDNHFDEMRALWKQEQRELRRRLILHDDVPWSLTPSPGKEPLRLIGGVDISFIKGNDVDACASLVVLEFPSLKVVYSQCKMVQLRLPYISGFLAFREVPFLLELLDDIRRTHPHLYPQLIMVDGNGILHPRGFGQACHLGVLADIPTIGVGKTFLFVDGLSLDRIRAEHVPRLLADDSMCSVDLVGDSGKVLGAAVRSTTNTTNPVFVSQGHRVSLETAVEVVLRCCRHRIPEPTRQADIQSREYLRIIATTAP